jgi:ankyrin repeat protein
MSDENRFTVEPLHIAVQDGDLSEVARLVEDGFDINAFDDLGKTPLHWAAKAENLKMVVLLLDHRADVNARHEPSIGDTPLGEIAGTCSFEMARILVAAGADPLIRGWMQLNALDRAKGRKRGDGPRVYELLAVTARR